MVSKAAEYKLAEYEDWEPEVEAIAPQGNDSIATEALLLHKSLSEHRAHDKDETWGDIGLYLPEKALPLANEHNKIRNLLTQAISDGVVSIEDLDETCLRSDETIDEQLKQILCYVIGDLSAYIEHHLGFGGKLNLNLPSYETELQVADAMEWVDDLVSGWNAPLRFYLKEFKQGLLTAEEEISLGREMEESGSAALDALSQWPEGLAIVYAAAEQVATGEGDVESYSSGAEPSGGSTATISDEGFSDNEMEVTLGSDAAAFVEAIKQAKSFDGVDAKSLRAALRKR